MRYAISKDGNFVSAHFGRCPEFSIVDIAEGKVINHEVIPNPGHHPGFIPKYLAEKNVNVIVTGGMGARASSLFNDFNIGTYLGITGSIDTVIDNLCSGDLVSGESLCKSGQGKGYGVEKTECDHDGDHHH